MIFESFFEYPMTHLDNFWVLFECPKKASRKRWHGGSWREQQCDAWRDDVFHACDPYSKYPVGDVHKLGGVRSTIKSAIFIISWVFERRAAGISWKGVLVIHIIMGRVRPKGVKESRPRTVNTTQKSKHNKGGNGGTAAANGERSTTALCSLSKMSKESAVCCHAQHCIKKMWSVMNN